MFSPSYSRTIVTLVLTEGCKNWPNVKGEFPWMGTTIWTVIGVSAGKVEKSISKIRGGQNVDQQDGEGQEQG